MSGISGESDKGGVSDELCGPGYRGGPFVDPRTRIVRELRVDHVHGSASSPVLLVCVVTIELREVHFRPVRFSHAPQIRPVVDVVWLYKGSKSLA